MASRHGGVLPWTFKIEYPKFGTPYDRVGTAWDPNELIQREELLVLLDDALDKDIAKDASQLLRCSANSLRCIQVCQFLLQLIDAPGRCGPALPSRQEQH